LISVEARRLQLLSGTMNHVVSVFSALRRVGAEPGNVPRRGGPPSAHEAAVHRDLQRGAGDVRWRQCSRWRAAQEEVADDQPECGYGAISGAAEVARIFHHRQVPTQPST
jgi:hypothetical protein